MDKKEMKQELEDWREYRKNDTIKQRLIGIPFSDSEKLFNIHNIPIENCTLWYGRLERGYPVYPCNAFGEHLVLKIVDELLDD